MLKEQSLDPSFLLAQTKPEGVSPRVSEPTKHKGPVIVPIITHLDLACFVWANKTRQAQTLYRTVLLIG